MRTPRHPLLVELDRLELPQGHWVLFGSGPLLARRWIEDVGDLDVLARGPAWDRARLLGRLVHLANYDVEVVEIGDGITVGTEWAIGGVDVDRLIDQAEMIDWTPCAPIADVVAYKELADRAKDRDHLRLIEYHLGREGEPRQLRRQDDSGPVEDRN